MKNLNPKNFVCLNLLLLKGSALLAKAGAGVAYEEDSSYIWDHWGLVTQDLSFCGLTLQLRLDF